MTSSQASDYPMWQVVVASFTTGLVIAVYILAMGRLDSERSVEDPVKTQAFEAATYLLSMSERHEGLGLLGLCDSTTEPMYGQPAQRITSLNNAKATIHCASRIFQTIRSSTVEQHLLHDVDLLDSVQRKLIARCFDEVSPQHTQNLRERILAALKHDEPPDLRSTAMTIQLGRYHDDQNRDTVKTIPATGCAPDAAFVDKGFYRAEYPVPILGNKTLSFSPAANGVTMVRPDQFMPCARGALPNAVLLEVTYEPKEKTATAVRIVRRACAVFGGAAPPTMPSSFMMRFPEGLPDRFKKPINLFQEEGWRTPGQWLQAYGGSVPGNGRLTISIDPILPEMKPSDALSLGLYHWIRHMRPAPDPAKVLAALSLDFPISDGKIDITESSLPPVNSCLVRDTGARERVLARSTESAEGQRAIERCFEYQDSSPEYPENAMPLYVDSTGNLNLAGRTGFDMQLVKRYLDAVYSTNLAALETLATTKQIQRQSAMEHRELQLRLNIARQELVSLTNRLSSLTAQKRSLKENSKIEDNRLKTEKTESNIADLKAAISADENRNLILKTVDRLARTTALNAERSSAKTYELSANSFSLLRNGLHSFDNNEGGFLIGRKSIFLPQIEPVDESDFFTAAKREVNDSSFGEKERAKVSPWFQTQMQILSAADEVALKEDYRLTINNRSVGDIMAEVAANDTMPPLTVLIDSRDLEAGEHIPKLHKTAGYPYAGTPIIEGQGFFYNLNATTTGANQEVVWSSIVRDLVLHEGTRGRSTVSSRSWTKDIMPPLDSPPYLGLEFQLRRPLPNLKELPPGAYIADPKRHMMVPQVPPVPSSML